MSTLYLFIDGETWTVERRTEHVPNVVRGHIGRDVEYLFFTSPNGEIRRSEVASSFPAEPAAPLLSSVWRNAEVLHAGSPGEMKSRGTLVMPRLVDLGKALWRSLVVACPHCGGRPVLRGWFHLREVCPVCGIRLERGEGEDYYLGGMMFNIAIAEFLFAIVFLIALVVMWPNVPWNAIEYTLVVAMIVAPIVLYPTSRLMWLGMDLLFRPPDRLEMQWHADETHGQPRR